MISESDLQDLKNHIEDRSGSTTGELSLGVEVASEERLIADGDYSDYTYKLLNIPEEGHSYLIDAMKNLIQNFLDSIQEGVGLSEYDIRSVNQDHTPIQYISKDEIPNFHRFHELTSENQIEETSTYAEVKPDFQAYILDTNPIITGFRVFTQRQVIESDEFRMYESDEKYSHFDRDLFTLPKDFDAIFYDGELIINNPNNFEKIFDYFEVYRSHADDVLSTILNSDINIRDFDKFVQAILDDSKALRKMKAIEDIGLYETIERNDVERVINEYDLSIIVDESGGEWELVIPDYRYKWDVIRLLNDDHLHSELTDGNYQVYGKDRR